MNNTTTVKRKAQILIEKIKDKDKAGKIDIGNTVGLTDEIDALNRLIQRLFELTKNGGI